MLGGEADSGAVPLGAGDRNGRESQTRWETLQQVRTIRHGPTGKGGASPTSHRPPLQLSQPEAAIGPMLAFLQQTSVQNRPNQLPPSSPQHNVPLVCCTCLWFCCSLLVPIYNFLCCSQINPSCGGEITYYYYFFICKDKSFLHGEGKLAGRAVLGGQVWVTDVGCLPIPAGPGTIQRNRWQESRPPVISAPAGSPDIKGLPRFTAAFGSGWLKAHKAAVLKLASEAPHLSF